MAVDIKKKIDVAQNIDIASSDRENATLLSVQLENDNTLAGAAVAIQGKNPNSATYVPIPYKRRSLLGAASDDTNVSAALGLSFLVQVDAAGLDIRIAVTGGAITGSGTLTVTAVKG